MVWKAVATCHYACGVRHLHARAGQSLWQAIAVCDRLLAVLGLIGQVSFRSCQPIVGILMANLHCSYQHLACHQSQGTWCKPLRIVSLSSLGICSQKHCERPNLTGSVTKRMTPRRKESTQSLHHCTGWCPSPRLWQ